MDAEPKKHGPNCTNFGCLAPCDILSEAIGQWWPFDSPHPMIPEGRRYYERREKKARNDIKRWGIEGFYQRCLARARRLRPSGNIFAERRR